MGKNLPLEIRNYRKLMTSAGGLREAEGGEAFYISASVVRLGFPSQHLEPASLFVVALPRASLLSVFRKCRPVDSS